MATSKQTAAKARRAASHPDRPGERCAAAPGAFTIRIDRARCEGKGDCVDVCPYDVFVVDKIRPKDFAQLSFAGKLKSLAHGRKTAFTPNSHACRACGLCVVACPERAITLVPVVPRPA